MTRKRIAHMFRTVYRSRGHLCYIGGHGRRAMNQQEGGALSSTRPHMDSIVDALNHERSHEDEDCSLQRRQRDRRAASRRRRQPDQGLQIHPLLSNARCCECGVMSHLSGSVLSSMALVVVGAKTTKMGRAVEAATNVDTSEMLAL